MAKDDNPGGWIPKAPELFEARLEFLVYIINRYKEPDQFFAVYSEGDDGKDRVDLKDAEAVARLGRESSMILSILSIPHYMSIITKCLSCPKDNVRRYNDVRDNMKRACGMAMDACGVPPEYVHGGDVGKWRKRWSTALEAKMDLLMKSPAKDNIMGQIEWLEWPTLVSEHHSGPQFSTTRKLTARPDIDERARFEHLCMFMDPGVRSKVLAWAGLNPIPPKPAPIQTTAEDEEEERRAKEVLQRIFEDGTQPQP